MAYLKEVRDIPSFFELLANAFPSLVVDTLKVIPPSLFMFHMLHACVVQCIDRLLKTNCLH